MKTIASLILFLFLAPISNAQSVPDSLNRFDAKKHKTGYWLVYTDSNFVKTEKNNAVYCAYEYYINGKQKFAPLPMKNKREWATIVYEPANTIYVDSLPLLNGVARYYYKDTLHALEQFKNGRMTYVEDHQYVMDGEKYLDTHSTEVIYTDSLFENKPFSMLIYTYDNDSLIYKQYGGSGIHEERIYLVPHTTHTSINRPRIGYTYQERSFLELGYSKKFARTTDLGNGDVYFDETNFPGFTLSLLGSRSKKRGNYFGQKALFSYAYTFVNSEIGFVNYTDFQNNDLRFTVGAGISIAGRFSLMYHYSLPVLSGSFTDISQHSFSVVLF